MRVVVTGGTGFIGEPLLSAGGLMVPPPGFYAALQNELKRRDMLMILDESQTGLGKTGKLFGFQHEPGVMPDIIVLSKHFGGGLPISAVVTTAAIAEMAAFAPQDLVLLPLYPQYSKTTTGSSVNEWNRCFERNGWSPNVRLIETFYDDPAYLDSVVSAINACLREGEDLADLDMVFSAHSGPIAVIEGGDPYQRQIEHTVDLVWKRGGWPARRHTRVVLVWGRP
jgi:hypothetical protein